MGVVYEAEQSSLGRRVALKVLPLRGLGDANTLERFKREARAAARLHHTNIVPVFDVGKDGDHCYYAMQYIQGQGLDQIVEELRRLRLASREPQVPEKSNGSVPGAGAPSPLKADAPCSPDLAVSLLTGRFAAPDATVATFAAEAPPLPVKEQAEPGVTTSVVLPGQTELSAVESNHRHYFDSVARIGRQTASALAHAHERGIVHRDIKPSNLLLDASGIVWITDFGLAKTEEDALTRTGDILGTIRYMSPERFQGRCDPRADIYALGMTLFELLVLRPAFESRDRMALMSQISADEPARPRTIDQRIPLDLETIVLKAIAKDPERRYQTANEMGQDLRRFLEGEPIKARRTSLVGRARMWSRRHPALAGLYAVLSLAVFCLTLFAIYIHGLLEESESVRKQKAVAEEEKTEQLYQSLKDQARASRFGRRLGQRYESLKALSKAAKLAHDLNKPEESFLDLRNEAIACFALQDLQVVQECGGWSELAYSAKFDSNLEHYARTDRGGRVVICSTANNGAAVRSLGGSELAFSPNGRFIVLEDRDRRWALWDLEIPAASPLLSSDSVEKRFSFSPDNLRFAVSAGDGSITVYDLPSGKQHTLLGGTTNRLCSVVFHPREPKIAEVDNSRVVIRDLETGKVLQQFSYPLEPYPSAKWHPDGKVLAAVGGDQIIRFWDVAGGKEISRLEGFKNGGNTLTFHASGDLVATAGWEGRVRLWNWRLGLQLLNVPADTVTLQFSSEGDRLACALDLKRLKIWEVAPAREYRTLVRDLSLGKGGYSRTAISTDGRLLAAGCRDGFGLWDLPSGKPLHFVPQRWTTSVHFEPSGSLLTHGEDGLIRWPLKVDPNDQDLIHIGSPSVISRLGAAAGAGQSKDGTVTAFGLLNGGAGILLEQKNRRITHSLMHGDVWAADVIPDGRWVVTGCHHSSGVKIWEAATGRLVNQLLGLQNACGVGFSPDGKWLATTGGGLRLWAAGSWEEGPIIGGGDFAFYPDGKLLAVETGRGSIRLVDPGTGREYATLEDPNQDRVSGFTFSGDGGLLAAVSGDSDSIHIWDLRTIREELAKMRLDWDQPSLTPAPPAPKNPRRIVNDTGKIEEDDRSRTRETDPHTVSWAATGLKTTLFDPARALTEVMDFKDLAGAGLEEFNAWRASLGPNFRLALLNSRDEAGRATVNAVAVAERKPRPIQFFPEMTREEGDRNWERLLKAGSRSLLICDYMKGDRLVSSQLWLAGEAGWNHWCGPLSFIIDRINHDTKELRRPIYLHAPAPAGSGEQFRFNSSSQGTHKWQVMHGLTAEELPKKAAASRDMRWRPDLLAPYMDGGRLRFMLVTVDNYDEVDWRFRTDMSLQEYRAESAQQKRQGLFPLCLVSYEAKDEARYAAIWVRYRLPAPAQLIKGIKQ
jgi:WD40 repeat protein